MARHVSGVGRTKAWPELTHSGDRREFVGGAEGSYVAGLGP